MTLDLNCEASYHESFFTPNEAQEIYDYLTSIEAFTKLHVIKIANGDSFTATNGKIIFTDQSLIDGDKFPSDIWGENFPWSALMLQIKNRVEELTGHQFQVCVCIYYPDGQSYIGFHSDQISYGDTSIIPSLSFGAQRKFLLKENSTQKTFDIQLANGSMLVMGENCQEMYEHALPIDPECKDPRINLTFRKVGD